MSTAHPVVDELIKGQTMTNELKALLHSDSGPPTIGALLDGISASFSRSIMLVQSNAFMMADHEQEERPSSSSKRKQIHSPRPGGYKRRTPLSEGRKELKSSMDDGYSWRKYGQKNIFTAKYPRCYFRCRHKYDQQCQATRLVQRWGQDPSMFEITYIGNHTCDQQPPLALDPSAAAAASIKHECYNDDAPGDKGCLATKSHHLPVAMSAGELPHFERIYAAGDLDDDTFTLQALDGCYIDAGITSSSGTRDIDAWVSKIDDLGSFWTFWSN